MRIDTNIIKAIDKYLTENKVYAMDFARMLNVSPATMTKWKKVGNGITDTKWNELFPLIQKYLPQDRIFINDAGVAQYSSAVQTESGYFFDPKYVPQMIPAFSVDMIAQYDNMLESVTQFGKRTKTPLVEYRAKHENKTGVFAVKIDADDLYPVIPAGSTLFACTSETPANGNVVILKTHSNEIIIGRYEQTNSTFRVLSPDGKTQKMSGRITEARSMIQWIFPVLYYEVTTF